MAEERGGLAKTWILWRKMQYLWQKKTWDSAFGFGEWFLVLIVPLLGVCCADTLVQISEMSSCLGTPVLIIGIPPVRVISEYPNAWGNLCWKSVCPVTWNTQLDSGSGDSYVCRSAQWHVSSEKCGQWTSLYGHKLEKEGKTVWIINEQQYFGNIDPLLQGQDPGFVWAQWVHKQQGPNPVGYGAPCSLLQPRRIHGWAIDWGTHWVFCLQEESVWWTQEAWSCS